MQVHQIYEKKKAESKEKENIKRFKVLLGIIKHIRCYN